MENEEKQFIEGFNNGYLIAKHEPELMNKISKKLEPTNDYLSGFLNGQKEFEIENQQMQFIALQEIRKQQKFLGNELDRNI